MRYEEILDGLLKVLGELAEESMSTPIIVEGEKDTAALRALDIEGEILMVNSGLPLVNFCERVSRSHRCVIVMTDWDARGGTLCRRIQENLEANGTKPDLRFRKRIAVLCRKDVKDVESLPNYILTLERWTRENRNEGARSRTEKLLRHALSIRRSQR